MDVVCWPLKAPHYPDGRTTEDCRASESDSREQMGSGRKQKARDSDSGNDERRGQPRWLMTWDALASSNRLYGRVRRSNSSGGRRRIGCLGYSCAGTTTLITATATLCREREKQAGAQER